MDLITWLADQGLYVAGLIVCGLCIYFMWPKAFNPRRVMEKTFLHTHLYLKDERRKTSRKIMPKLIRCTAEEWGYVFKYKLPAGMSVVQFIEKKAYINTAFNGESAIRGKGNVLTIEVMTMLLPDRVHFDLTAVTSVVRQEVIPLVLGYSNKGIRVLDLAEVPHGLISGDSGAGKSVFVRQLLTALVKLRSPQQLHLTLFDLKNGLELSLFRHLAHVQSFAKDVNELEGTLNFVRDVMNDRGDLFASSGLVDIHEYNREHPKDPLPFHLVVIDELAEIVYGRIIERILRRGRVYGVHLLLVTLEPDAVKAEFPLRIHFKMKNGINKLPLVFGRAKVEFNGECMVQGLFLSHQEAKQIINEA